jgi:hypothetical protein
LGRLAAILGALLAAVLIPLALSPTTAWLILPGHLTFTLLASAAAVAEGWLGHPGRARAWGGGYLVASVGMVAALELGSRVFGQGYTWLPWTAVLIWGWVPPVVSGLSGALGEQRRRRLARLSVGQRKQAAARPSPQR